MIMSCFGITPLAFSGEDVKSYVVYDLTGNDYRAKYYSTGASYYPEKLLDDGTYQTMSAIYFRSRVNVKIADVGVEKALCYYYKTDDTYTTFYATTDGVSRESVSSGRLVFTSRVYASTEKHTAAFKASGLRNDASYSVTTRPIGSKTAEKLKAKTWYNMKMAIDLDNDHVRYSFTEENPSGSAAPHIISGASSYFGDTFESVRLDLDIYEGTAYNSETDEGDFIAYDDFRLTYNTHSSKINPVSNGNVVSTTFDKGVFTAETAGSGLFAIALYKDDEIVSLSVAENEEELESVKLNMIVDDMSVTAMKIFRFDSDGTPICINKTLTPKEKNYEVYFNETFDGKVIYAGAQPNGTTRVLSDGRMIIKGDGTRFGAFPIKFPEKNIIIEADFELPEGKIMNSRLFSLYYANSPHCIIYMNGSGIKSSTSSSNTDYFVTKSEIEKDRSFSLALKLDLENHTYDVYYNREYRTTKNLDSNIPLSGFSVYIPQHNSSSELYIDNIRAYSGTEFIDIGNERANVHKYSHENAEGFESDIYDRPSAELIVKTVLNSSRPRIIINQDRVAEIKKSSDPRIAQMRETVIEKADNYLTQEPYSYKLTNGSLDNVDDGLTMIMNLGMAYLLTGESKYPARAYREAEVLFTVPSEDYYGNSAADRDYWNSYSYLDIGEISAIMSICYDWMYDGFTPEQRKQLETHTMEKGILRSFRTIYSEYNPTTINPNDFSSSNNWGAICNGGILMASIAFMEADPFMCSEMAEANIRGVENILGSYAPSGAWSEGTGYWAYALKYLTFLSSTLDSVFGTDFGISKTEGLRNSQYFSIASEGKVSVVNYGDASSSRVNTPFMFYWANKYKDEKIGAVAAYIKEAFNYTYGVHDLLYYVPDYVNDGYDRPHYFYFNGDTEQVTMDSDSLEDGTFIAMTGGKGTASNHDHLDSGSIILDMNGWRIIRDSGAEHYKATGYFASSRYWYYKARPEGHNIFVINPDNLYDTDGTTYYHGQDRTAMSEISERDEENKSATINLSAAYARDVNSAYRTVRLDGRDAVIEDEISLKSDGNTIEWYYHYSDIISYLHDGGTEYKAKSFVNADGKPYCEVTSDGNKIYLTYQDYTYTDDGSSKGKITFNNTFKTFEFEFICEGADIEITTMDAMRNPYDADVLEALRNKTKVDEETGEIVSASEFLYDNHGYYLHGNSSCAYAKNGYTYPLDKIVVKAKNVSGDIKLKTIVRAK